MYPSIYRSIYLSTSSKCAPDEFEETRQPRQRFRCDRFTVTASALAASLRQRSPGFALTDRWRLKRLGFQNFSLSRSLARSVPLSDRAMAPLERRAAPPRLSLASHGAIEKAAGSSLPPVRGARRGASARLAEPQRGREAASRGAGRGGVRRQAMRA